MPNEGTKMTTLRLRFRCWLHNICFKHGCDKDVAVGYDESGGALTFECAQCRHEEEIARVNYREAIRSAWQEHQKGLKDAE